MTRTIALLTPDDVAERTGLTRKQVDRLIKIGELPAVSMSSSAGRANPRMMRVALQDLTDYVLGVIQEANDD